MSRGIASAVLPFFTASPGHPLHRRSASSSRSAHRLCHLVRLQHRLVLPFNPLFFNGPPLSFLCPSMVWLREHSSVMIRPTSSAFSMNLSVRYILPDRVYLESIYLQQRHPQWSFQCHGCLLLPFPIAPILPFLLLGALRDGRNLINLCGDSHGIGLLESTPAESSVLGQTYLPLGQSRDEPLAHQLHGFDSLFDSTLGHVFGFLALYSIIDF